jgi:hypothetical protein
MSCRKAAKAAESSALDSSARRHAHKHTTSIVCWLVSSVVVVVALPI